ncbi:MAG TPA: pirin family protein [Steroidobacteraceae bacterium]|nr:pirin family protein [Steroidobacteraceae bacterium]
MAKPSILTVSRIGHPWATPDPFLFCVYHQDAYPRGNSQLGPDVPLDGRHLGQDFAGKDGWRMYHGHTVPGFPAHPHRGFETVTIMRDGYIDHSDSLGASARFGRGDVQWLTAGEGIVHSEMFPLLSLNEPNPLELFQIWLNLPKRSKLARPYFTMLWSEDIPRENIVDSRGAAAGVVTYIAGPPAGRAEPGLPPPPDSWASDPTADLAIWTLNLSAGARWTLPPARSGDARRTLYFFKGATLVMDGTSIPVQSSIEVDAAQSIEIANGVSPSELLMLQGRPIGEPVAQHGPFVMNTEQELRQAYADYHHSQFGGWPWPDAAPVHGAGRGRFARHADGRLESRSEKGPAG